MVELIVGCVFLVLFVVGGGIYFADRTGWNRTVKRISRISRASIESKKIVDAVEPRKGAQKALAASWDAEFAGKAVVVATEAKHAIVRHDYAHGLGDGLWPRWVCKCGASGETPSGIWSEAATQRKTVAEGADHVRVGNNIERHKAAKNDFMF